PGGAHAHLPVVAAGDVTDLLARQVARPLPAQVDAERPGADVHQDHVLRRRLGADPLALDQHAGVVLHAGVRLAGGGDEPNRLVHRRGGRGGGGGRAGRPRGRRGGRGGGGRRPHGGAPRRGGEEGGQGRM